MFREKLLYSSEYNVKATENMQFTFVILKVENVAFYVNI
jgi:hypothetical protein